MLSVSNCFIKNLIITFFLKVPTFKRARDSKCIICDPTKTYNKDESGAVRRLSEIEGHFIAVMMYDWDSPSWSEVRKEQAK